MIIQHNISALNANRQLKIVNNTGSKSSEKLSSGYRINRAADDAAGLSMSEKMRRQIRGLGSATENVEDGISLCQVADGAMAEMQDMTNRMNELCVQAANGTNSSPDRSYIQMEIDEIVTEFNRIINSTKFNELYIFQEEKKLSYGGGVQKPPTTTINRDLDLSAVEGIEVHPEKQLTDKLPADFAYNNDWITTTPNTGNQLEAGTNCAWVDFTDFTAKSREELIEKLEGQGFDSSCNRCTKVFYGIKFVADGNNNEVTPSGIPYHYHSSPANIPMPVPTGIVSEVLKIDLNNIWDRYNKPGESRTLGELICSTLVDVIDNAGGPPNTFGQAGQLHHNSCLTQHFTGYAYKKGTGKLYIAIGPKSTNAGSSTFSVTPRDDEGNIEVSKPIKPIIVKPEKKEYVPIPKRQIAIHAGTDANSTNKVMIKLPTMNMESLKLDKISVLTENLATDSIKVLTDTLQFISSDRSRMGAYQNRLEHTSLNLNNVIENTTASESRIRDTNMAKEMIHFSNNNILAQASQSMLSQANNNIQNVLSLITA